jgi:ABC-type multidrug transport system fused ATPase/permease subunit
MGFIMDGLDAEAYDRSYGDAALLQRIAAYFRPYARQMGLVAGAITLAALMDIALPLLIRFSLDRLTAAPDLSQALWTRATPYLLAVLLAGVFGWVCNYVRQSYTARVVGNVVFTLRKDAFDAVLDRDMSFYDEFSSGKVVSRVTSDTQDFSNVVTLTLNRVSQLLLVVILFAILFFIDVPLSLLAVLIAFAIILIALQFRRIARHNTQQARRVLAQINAQVQESVSGIVLAKNFRQEQTVYDEFRVVNAQVYRYSLRQGLTFSAIFPILGTVAGVGTALMLYFGGNNVLAGNISAGDWFLFLEGLALLWFPLTSIASFWSQFQLGLAASERVFALIDAEPRVVQIDSQPVDDLAGRIEFRQVDFRYTEQERVLNDFSLTIEAGETVALVGHTGAGKSSLGKLVARFYEFQGGELLIDGRNIRTFDLHFYRRRLGIVPQTPFLFSGTVADNIRYGAPHVSDEAVEATARQVGGGDWLLALPQGLETPVGEEGRGISMGQRQLVALARVLLQDPGIVILDEATASVDPLTEAQIQEGLETVLQGRTAIVIAHRLSTIKAADRIIVLRKGRIIEEGDHNSLMQAGGHYAELYNTYFRHQSPDYDPERVVANGAVGEPVTLQA